MDRNLWLAVGLSALVYLGWFGFLEKRITPPKEVHPSAAFAVKPAETKPGAPAPAEAPMDAKTLLSEAETVKFGDAEAKIHPRGAAIVSFFVPEPLGVVELVHDPKPGLFSTFPELSFRRDATVKNGLVYAAERPDGLRVTKQYLPGEGTVLPRVRVTIANSARKPQTTPAWTLTVGPGLGTIDTEKKENERVWRAIALTPEGKGLKGRVETLKAGAHPGPFRWSGVDNRYFLAALLASPEHFGPVYAAAPPQITLTANPVELKPGGSFTWEVPFYLGPKGHTWLSRYDLGLERSIDFGFFAQLGRWMLGALERIHRSVGNWGWAIVLLTVALQILLFPLTWKSLKAAASMKKLQPQIQRLQQRHADDPTKLNQEMMALYKTSGANPLGGCLPMVLQMPIFIALYNALRNSWELHGAGWLGWITDLSAKDPYYALPLIMGALMFVQSKLNPPATDPAQQKVMMFMPVIFTFMFLNFPSGLVLYWLTNSLVSTALQIGLKDRLEA